MSGHELVEVIMDSSGSYMVSLMDCFSGNNTDDDQIVPDLLSPPEALLSSNTVTVSVTNSSGVATSDILASHTFTQQSGASAIVVNSSINSSLVSSSPGVNSHSSSVEHSIGFPNQVRKWKCEKKRKVTVFRLYGRMFQFPLWCGDYEDIPFIPCMNVKREKGDDLGWGSLGTSFSIHT